jgi:endoglucanase Acf2
MRVARHVLSMVLVCGLPADFAEAFAQDVVRIGAGSFASSSPPGAKAPPETIYQTENVRGKMPTNDWWSSLAWMPFSERQYAHPLAFQAERAGLRVFYPAGRITVNRVGIFGTMPDGGDDLIVGHSGQAEFPDARVDGFSDWFVTARFGPPGRSMTVSYGHGSPYVYARYEGGTARLTFPTAPQVWSGDGHGPILGVTIGGSHYGLFGPSGSSWTGIGTSRLTNQADKPYFSLALLPDASEKTLQLFKRYAHSHVVDTRVAWNYEPAKGTVTTTFRFTTEALEGDEKGTIFALYPHQWRNTDHPLLSPQFQSVRGVMSLGEGDSFRTTMRFPGGLALPAERRRW